MWLRGCGQLLVSPANFAALINAPPPPLYSPYLAALFAQSRLSLSLFLSLSRPIVTFVRCPGQPARNTRLNPRDSQIPPPQIDFCSLWIFIALLNWASVISLCSHCTVHPFAVVSCECIS
eukprot:Opistho-2@37585